MLDVQMLEVMPGGTRFATGESTDNPAGINMTNSGKGLRWVAVRGFGPLDWAIYIHWDTSDIEYIARHGDKVHSDKNIRALVPCDDVAFAAYRH
jgi:hypothetical protein